LLHAPEGVGLSAMIYRSSSLLVYEVVGWVAELVEGGYPLSVFT
jgi:hypothetical protein